MAPCILANTVTTVSNPAANTSNYKTWADICSVTITGRIFHVEKLSNNQGEYLAFTVITNTVDDDTTGMSVKFYTSQPGLIRCFDEGWLPNGRRVTVIGSIKEVRNSYTNRDGELVALKRPEVQLQRVDLTLGASPKAK